MVRNALVTSLLFQCIVGAVGAADAVEPSAAGCSVAVRVVQIDGTPAPAGVVVLARAENGLDHERVWSGADQALVFDRVPCGSTRLAAGVRIGEERRFSAWDAMDVLLADGSVAQPVVLTIPSSGSVRVRVVDPEGEAVPAGTVVVRPEGGRRSPGASQSTADVGRSGTAFLALLRGGHTVRLESDAVAVVGARVNGKPVGVPANVEIEAGSPVELEFSVGRPAFVAGRIVDEDGNGVPGIEVDGFAIEAPGTGTGRAVSDEAGRFVLALRGLPARVTATARHGIWEIEPPSVAVTPGNSDTVTFRARPGERLLHGRVVFEGDGRPVAGATVVRRPRCGPATRGRLHKGPRFAATGGDGTFVVPCDPDCPGNLSMVPDALRHLGRRTPVRAATCDEVLVLRVPPPCAIRGRVLDHDGGPLAGFLLEARLGDSTHATGMTDIDGEFQLNGLAPGEYRLEPRAVAGVLDSALIDGDGLLAQVPLVRPGEVADRNLRRRPGGPICVEVSLDSGEEVPVEIVEVVAADAERIVASAEGTYSLLRTDPHTLCTPPVPAGEYRVRADGEHFLPAWCGGAGGAAGAVRVANGPVTVKMTVAPAGRMTIDLPGWEPDADDAPRVELRRAADPGEWRGHPGDRVQPNALYRRYRPAEWNEAPRFIVTDVPAGRWAVRACRGAAACDEEMERPVWTSPEPVEVSSGGEVRVRLSKPPDDRVPVEATP